MMTRAVINSWYITCNKSNSNLFYIKEIQHFTCNNFYYCCINSRLLIFSTANKNLYKKTGDLQPFMRFCNTPLCEIKLFFLYLSVFLPQCRYLIETNHIHIEFCGISKKFLKQFRRHTDTGSIGPDVMGEKDNKRVTLLDSANSL